MLNQTSEGDATLSELSIQAQKIQLISSTSDTSIEVERETLRKTFPYFESLFDSAFADANKRVFTIEKVTGGSGTVECLLFKDYPRDPINFASTLRAHLKSKPELRTLVALNRLAGYYGLDLQGTCEAELLFTWQSLGTTITARRLESCLKACRALVATTNDTDDLGYPITKTKLFSTFLGYHATALRMAWDMSPTQQEAFWPELLDFTTGSRYGKRQYPALVMPYFRILQSLPSRPTLASEDFVLDTLVSALDEAHFEGMKGHRESNGHQHGDFALHPKCVIERMSRKQLLWCWREWSDSEVGRSGNEADYPVLLHRLAQSWDTMVLNDELGTLTRLELGNLSRELKMRP